MGVVVVVGVVVVLVVVVVVVAHEEEYGGVEEMGEGGAGKDNRIVAGFERPEARTRRA